MEGVNLNRLIEEQRKLARAVVTSDSKKRFEHIGGCNCSAYSDMLFCAVVVVDRSFKIVDKSVEEMEASFPYIPSFLAYRELPVIIKAYENLRIKPDLLVVAGHGILHPRRIGLASHLGVSLSIPSIGVAKSLIIGRVDGSKVYVGKELRGFVLSTKNHAKPIYVSPGHLIGAGTALNTVVKLMKKHKFPEPIAIAHSIAVKAKNEYKSEHKEE